MKKCINCGNELPENAQFCANCGAPQEHTANTTNANPINAQPTPTPADSVGFGVPDEPQQANTINTEYAYTAPAPAKKSNKKMIALIAIIAASVVIIIAVVTAVFSISSDVETNSTTALSSSTTAAEITEKETTETTMKKTTNYYNSSLWEKSSENTSIFEYITYNYKMGPGTFSDKINSAFKNNTSSGLKFSWAGDKEMDGYTRRVFGPGGLNELSAFGYGIDFIEYNDEYYIGGVCAMIDTSLSTDYDYDDYNQMMATLCTMALYAYDAIPYEAISPVMKTFYESGCESFRYNDFIVMCTPSQNGFYALIFRGDYEGIQRDKNIIFPNYAELIND